MTFVLINRDLTGVTDSEEIQLNTEDLPIRIDILTTEAITLKIKVRTAGTPATYIPLFVDGFEWSIETNTDLSETLLPHVALSLGTAFIFNLAGIPAGTVEIGLQVERGS